MPTEANQQQFAEQLAQQLKGLEMPEAISWWPLAIGWWFVIAIILIVITIIVIKLRNKSRENKYRKTATAELQNTYKKWQNTNQDLVYLESSNAILKRVIRVIERNENSLNKSGQDWSDVLQGYAKEPLSEESITALCTECYQAKPNVDIDHLHSQLTSWLSNHHRGQHA